VEEYFAEAIKEGTIHDKDDEEAAKTPTKKDEGKDEANTKKEDTTDTAKKGVMAEASSVSVQASKTEEIINQGRTINNPDDDEAKKAPAKKDEGKERTDTKMADMSDATKKEDVAEASKTEEIINQDKNMIDVGSSKGAVEYIPGKENQPSNVVDKDLDKPDGCKDESTPFSDSVSKQHDEKHAGRFWRTAAVFGALLGAGCVLMMSRANKGVKSGR
jgi:hypothetical protein